MVAFDKTDMDFEILSQTENPIKTIERAARTCYRSEDKMGSDPDFIQKLIRSGHESVLEHSSATVLIKDASRGLTHELVRHRIAAYSQESTRYVDQKSALFIMPPTKRAAAIYIPALTDRVLDIKEWVSHMYEVYSQLLAQGWPKEDARQFLPIGTASDIVVTYNFRQWRHVFKLRCADNAHWEIRTLMRDIRKEFISRWPEVFKDLSS